MAFLLYDEAEAIGLILVIGLLLRIFLANPIKVGGSTFFRSNIEPYGRKDLPVHFVGSMAFHYRSQLEEAARLEGYAIGQTMQSPMEGLIKYHS